MIESVMLVTLGFAAASLLALLAAPAFWGRALRLATLRIRASLPVSEAEIRAEKDLMRADYAIRVHQLEKEIDEHKLKSHRQFIEINRRDASVTLLSNDVDTLKSDLIENQNARLVLEQTVNDRLPKLELRLDDARRLISARDQEIVNLSHSTNRHAEVIEEARGIGAQQAAEIERLKAALSASQARDRRRFTDVATEQEFALRGELERLRGVTRDQDAKIERLSGELGAIQGSASSAVESGERRPGEITELDVLRGRQKAQDAEIDDLRRALSERPAAAFEFPEPPLGDGVRGNAAHGLAAAAAAAFATRASRPKAANSAGGDADAGQVNRLRAELAAANDRAARQAAYFTEEMRRLGAGRSVVPLPPSRAPILGAADRNGKLAEKRPERRGLVSISAPEEPAAVVQAPAVIESAYMDAAGSGFQNLPVAEAAIAPAAVETVAEAAGDRPRLLDRLRSYGDR